MERVGRRSLRHWGWLVGTLAAMLVLAVFMVGDGKYEKTTPKTTLVVRKALRKIPGTQYQGMMNIPKITSSWRNIARPPYQGINMVTKNSSPRNTARPPYQGINMVTKNSSRRNIATPLYQGINMVTKNSSWRMRAGHTSSVRLSRGGNRTTGKEPATIVARTQYPRVNMLKTRSQVKLDNGFVQLIFSRPSGDVVGIKYKGIDNLLENKNLRNNRGYWDVVWNNPGENKIFVDKLQATRFRVITARADQVEISFVKTYNVSQQRGAPVVNDSNTVQDHKACASQEETAAHGPKACARQRNQTLSKSNACSAGLGSTI